MYLLRAKSNLLNGYVTSHTKTKRGSSCWWPYVFTLSQLSGRLRQSESGFRTLAKIFSNFSPILFANMFSCKHLDSKLLQSFFMTSRLEEESSCCRKTPGSSSWKKKCADRNWAPPIPPTLFLCFHILCHLWFLSVLFHFLFSLSFFQKVRVRVALWSLHVWAC